MPRAWGLKSQRSMATKLLGFSMTCYALPADVVKLAGEAMNVHASASE